MAVTTTASTDGENRVITIKITAVIAKADNLADDAARFYYDTVWKNNDYYKTEVEGELTETAYDDLTTPKKLSILGKEAQAHLVQGGRAYFVDSAISAAKATAETEADERY